MVAAGVAVLRAGAWRGRQWLLPPLHALGDRANNLVKTTTKRSH
jgi:hypothetical protein